MSDRRTGKRYPLFSRDFFLHCLEKADILQKNDHFFIVVKYSSIAAFCIHVFLLFAFLLLQLKLLFLFNIASVACYAICYLINRKGYHYPAQFLICLELLIHAALAVYCLGWRSGFAIYIFGIIILVCLTPSRRYMLKTALALGLCLIYIGLNLLGETHIPVYSLSPSFQRIFSCGNSAAMLIMIAGLLQYYHFYVHRAERQLRQANHRLTLLARTDPLTNLLNRRGMGEILQYEAERFKETSRSFCIILADIDDFKLMNDQYGHECGDFVLMTLSERFKNALREQDQVARWGGEEFLILLPETDGARGMMIAERLQQQIEENVFFYKRQTIPLTVTFGLTVFDGYKDIKSAINDADEALFRGKAEGKNRVVRQ